MLLDLLQDGLVKNPSYVSTPMKYQVSLRANKWYLQKWNQHVIFACEKITGLFYGDKINRNFRSESSVISLVSMYYQISLLVLKNMSLVRCAYSRNIFGSIL